MQFLYKNNKIFLALLTFLSPLVASENGRDVPPSCFNQFNSLSKEKKSYVLERYKKEKKGLIIAYVACLFCLHDVYLGKGFRFLYFFTGGWCGYGTWINFFKIENLVNEANEGIFEKILVDVGGNKSIFKKIFGTKFF